MRKWDKHIDIEGESCRMHFEIDNEITQDDLSKVTIYDRNDEIIARGTYEDEAYADAREEILSRKE